MPVAKWIDCMPEDGVEGFTERSDERRQVFEDAAQRLPTELSPLVWAFLQVGNLEQVKECTANDFSWMAVHDKRESALESRAKNAVLFWKQRSLVRDTVTTVTTPASSKRTHSAAFFNHPPSSPLRTQVASPNSQTRTRPAKSLGAPEYSPQRDSTIAELCKERDRGLCAVSRLSAVDACYIYPKCAFGGMDPARVENFWETIRLFWPEDEVKSWYDKVFRDERGDDERGDGPKGIETVENMLTLTSTLHHFHSEGAFALRPVRITEDKTQLELEFHWLVRQERDSKARVDLLEQPLSSRNRKDSGDGYVFFRIDNTDGTRLVSGTRFTMTTDDSTNKPLPDPGLLKLQWHLQRILAMSGAAGWEKEDFDHYFKPSIDMDALPTVEQTVQHWLDD
jgi:hypothetical protein